MNKIRTGYCPICDSNVVHGRIFENRTFWQLDRLTFGVLERFKVGPWRCVDCGNRQMFIECRDDARRDVNEKVDQGTDATAPVGNFIRTKDALVQTVVDTASFSEKYRSGVVQKLLNGKVTVSKVCEDLSISEFEVQRWIRTWFESEFNRLLEAKSDDRSLTPNPARESIFADPNEDWSEVGPLPGRIIECDKLPDKDQP